MLPVVHIPLDAVKGVFRPCRWCNGAAGSAVVPKNGTPPNAVAAMICEGCERQTGWLTPKTLRKAESLA